MGHKSAVSVSLHSAKDPTKQKVNQKAKIRTVKQFSFHWCLSESRGKQDSRGHRGSTQGPTETPTNEGKTQQKHNGTTGPSGNSKGGGAGTAEEDRAEKAAPISH